MIMAFWIVYSDIYPTELTDSYVTANKSYTTLNYILSNGLALQELEKFCQSYHVILMFSSS